MDERCKQYHSALSRCAELLDNMKDGDPITEVPDFLAAYLASQSQAAQPSIKTWQERTHDDKWARPASDYMEAEITELRAHLAGQSQATRAATQAIALFERMLEAEFGKPGWPSVYDVEQCIKMLKGSAAQEVTQQAAPEAPTISAHNLTDAEIDSITRYFSQDKYYDSIRACVAFATERLEQRLDYVMRDLNGPTHFGEPVIATPSTQQAAKAETTEQAEGDQANVLPPMRGTDSQHDASESVLTNSRIIELAYVYGMKVRTGAGAIKFARAIEAELASRFRAQGGITNSNSPEFEGIKGSDIAPTTSTVSAPEEVRNKALEEAAGACKPGLIDGATAYEIAAIRKCADAIRALRTTSGKGEAA